MAGRAEYVQALIVGLVLGMLGAWITGPPDDRVPGGDPIQEAGTAAAAEAVAHFGWVPSTLEAPPGAEARRPPLHAIVVAAVQRRGLPEIDWLMSPADERAEPRPVPGDDLVPLDRLAARVLRVIVALAALFATLTLLEWGRGHGRRGLRFAALTAPIAAAFPPLIAHVHGRGDPGLVLALTLTSLACWLTLRALRDRALAQPFWSSARGALVGIALGLAVASWVGTMLVAVALEVALALRIFRRYRGPDGALRSARGLPVFATSIHKAALLTLLPFTVHSPHTLDAPWTIQAISWFQMGWLGVGWIFFAPYALVPRRATSRPLVAAAPALALALGLAVAMGGPSELLSVVGEQGAASGMRLGTALVAVAALVGAARLAREDPRALVPLALTAVLGASATLVPALLPALAPAAALGVLAILLSLFSGDAPVDATAPEG